MIFLEDDGYAEGEPTVEIPAMVTVEVDDLATGEVVPLTFSGVCYADACNAATKYVKATRLMKEGQK